MKTLHTKPIHIAKLALALGLALLPSLSPASGWTMHGSFNTSNGRPNGMTDSRALIPADILTRVDRLLGAEGLNIANNPDTQALLTDDLGGNVFLTKNANVKVVFLNEGAGYQNSIGFFRFSKAGLPKPTITGERIIFPNASTPPMGLGDTVDLGNFSAGEAIGFTVVANGWRSPAVRTDRPPTVVFRTIRALNPEQPPRNAHTVLLSSPENKLLVLGMEDLNRENRSFNDHGFKSDDDFNDIIIAILVDPFDAVDTGHIVDVDTGKIGGTNPTGGDGTTPRAVGVSGRQNWQEKTEQR